MQHGKINRGRGRKKKGEETHVDESEEHRTDETDDNSRQQAMRHTATDELYVTLRSTSTWRVMFFLRHRVQVRVQIQLCSFLQLLSDSECNVSDDHDNIQQQQNSEAEDVPCNTWMDGWYPNRREPYRKNTWNNKYKKLGIISFFLMPSADMKTILLL